MILYYNDFVSNIFVGDDGKLHKVQGGADTVLPFSNKPKVLDIANNIMGYSAPSYNIASQLPNDYQKLTLNNFVISNMRVSYSWSSLPGALNQNVLSSYDANTGTLCLNYACSGTSSQGIAYFMIYNLKCIY